MRSEGKAPRYELEGVATDVDDPAGANEWLETAAEWNLT